MYLLLLIHGRAIATHGHDLMMIQTINSHQSYEESKKVYFRKTVI